MRRMGAGRRPERQKLHLCRPSRIDFADQQSAARLAADFFCRGTIMSGETSLAALLRSMRPQLNEGSYVFCTLADWSGLQPDEVIGSFREQEGLTVIVSRARAEALKLPFSYEAAWITLTVHSSLEAVGLTAAFATALGQAGISCNVVAAFYHDHIFVAQADAQRAMAVLEGLAAGA